MVSCGSIEQRKSNVGDSIDSTVSQDVDKDAMVEQQELSVKSADIGADNRKVVEPDKQIRAGEDLELIQARYQEDEANNTAEDNFFRYPEYIEMIDNPELFEKAHMKAYRSYSSDDEFVGTYLIYTAEGTNDEVEESLNIIATRTVLPVFDTFEETCIADIDQNGEYELLSLCGFGSGIYRINLNVYQYSNPIYFSSLTKVLHLQYRNCFVPKQGYGKLVFDRVSDHEVGLREVDVETEQLRKEYGKLVVDQDMVHVVPENIEGFPYEIWDSVYNQENWPTDTFDSDELKEIPGLKVNVGETTIPVSSAKLDWEGEQEKTIAFPDLMSETIPRFAPPTNIYGSDQDICLDFGGMKPSSIEVTDTLLSEDGVSVYTDREIINRYVRNEGNGVYCFGLQTHYALLLSSSNISFMNPSYRGFRVVCEFGENLRCEYVFVLSLDPIEKE